MDKHPSHPLSRFRNGTEDRGARGLQVSDRKFQMRRMGIYVFDHICFEGYAVKRFVGCGDGKVVLWMSLSWRVSDLSMIDLC